MGDRLLHRRLREWANGNPDPMLKKCLHAHLAGSDLCKAHPSCTRCERAQAAALADEIERQYVPVPRTVNCTFEDEMFDFNPEKLTHKEPDSLEKLRDDLMIPPLALLAKTPLCDIPPTMGLWKRRLPCSPTSSPLLPSASPSR